MTRRTVSRICSRMRSSPGLSQFGEGGANGPASHAPIGRARHWRSSRASSYLVVSRAGRGLTSPGRNTMRTVMAGQRSRTSRADWHLRANRRSQRATGSRVWLHSQSCEEQDLDQGVAPSGVVLPGAGTGVRPAVAPSAPSVETARWRMTPVAHHDRCCNSGRYMDERPGELNVFERCTNDHQRPFDQPSSSVIATCRLCSGMSHGMFRQRPALEGPAQLPSSSPKRQRYMLAAKCRAPVR